MDNTILEEQLYLLKQCKDKEECKNILESLLFPFNQEHYQDVIGVRNMGEEVNRPFREGVGVRPTTPKPTLWERNGLRRNTRDSMCGKRPVNEESVPSVTQSSMISLPNGNKTNS